MEGNVGAAPAAAGDSNASDAGPGHGGAEERASKDAPNHKGDAGTAKKEASEKPDGEGKGEAQAQAKPKAPEKPAVRKYRLPTDDGGEEEVDEAEVKRRVVHAREANKRMEQAAVAQKQMEAFIEQLTTDPVAVLEHLAGQKQLKVDHIEAMEKRLAEHYKRQLMTPEQLHAEDNARKAKEYEDWKAAQHQQQVAQQQAAAQAHFEQEYDQKITAVLNASALPKTPGTVKRVASMMELAIKKGYEPDLNLIVDIVRNEYHNDTKSLYSGLEGEELVKFLGEEIAMKIRKYDLSRLKGRFQAEAPKTEPKPPRQNTKERLNPRDFFEQAMKRAGMK